MIDDYEINQIIRCPYLAHKIKTQSYGYNRLNGCISPYFYLWNAREKGPTILTSYKYSKCIFAEENISEEAHKPLADLLIDLTNTHKLLYTGAVVYEVGKQQMRFKIPALLEKRGSDFATLVVYARKNSPLAMCLTSVVSNLYDQITTALCIDVNQTGQIFIDNMLINDSVIKDGKKVLEAVAWLYAHPFKNTNSCNSCMNKCDRSI